MTARAIEALPPPAPAKVPGIASIAIHRLLSLPRATATVLGTSGHAVWLLVEDEVIVVSTSDGTRLPNGIEIAAESTTDVFRMVHHGAAASIGFGRIMLEGLTIKIARWWDPRPALPAITPTVLAVATAGLPSVVPNVESGAVRVALTSGSPNALLKAARPLLGKGPGLTPEGDDYLAGALAATRILGTAMGSTAAVTMLDAVSVPLAQLADVRTTTFSAALLQHALRGQVAEPAGAFLRAFTGRGDIADGHRELAQVGHTSGPALAAGMVLGAQCLISTSAERYLSPISATDPSATLEPTDPPVLTLLGRDAILVTLDEDGNPPHDGSSTLEDRPADRSMSGSPRMEDSD